MSNSGKKRTRPQPGGVKQEGKGTWTGHTLLVFLTATVVGLLNSHHVASLFENDRHFSHLSNLEREMTFRTEMGMYYSYFKTMVKADSVADGAYKLYRDNITEYPLVINTLKRFNLYPELAVGLLYRGMNSLGLLSQTCYQINRGEHMSPVESCEGYQDPPHFYINIVWLFSGLTTTLLFLLGYLLSGSLSGGLLPVICFFYNHGEATRVMWTPPLRESFAFPICLGQILAVSVATRSSRPGWPHVLSICVTTTLFIVCWQFAQFMLFTQICAIFAVYIVGILPRESLHTILVALTIGLLHAVVLMFGNEMLFTSWMFSSLLSALLVTLPLDAPLANLPILPRIISQVVLFFGLAFTGKVCIAKAFLVQDDAHIFEILKSKFSDFHNFHTLLYTCAPEFDFLGWEMPLKITQTLLLPAAVLASCILLYSFFSHVWSQYKGVVLDTQQQVDPAALYNLLQCAAYGVMAVLIMRLKLFLTPHLCILTSLLAGPSITSMFPITKQVQTSILVALVALMSIAGISNIQEQRSIMGEYQNYHLEELIEWINESLPPTAVLGGPMPVMANLLLSTGRPVVNHPHYEDVGLRERTKKVYTTFSRRTPTEVYQSLRDLQVEYLVLNGQWCLTTQRNGCALTEAWDVEEPYLKEQGNPPVCPILWKRPPLPFLSVFQNEEYKVLRVSPKVLELKPAKTKKI